MLVFWTIWFQNYTINCFSITFFGITKVANLNVIWMRANNSSHRQLTSCIIRCFDSRPGSEGEEPSLQCVITCYSIPRLFSLPCCISITCSSLSIVIYSLYCFSYSWWCLILFFSVLQKNVSLKIVEKLQHYPENKSLSQSCFF